MNKKLMKTMTVAVLFCFVFCSCGKKSADVNRVVVDSNVPAFAPASVLTDKPLKSSSITKGQILAGAVLVAVIIAGGYYLRNYIRSLNEKTSLLEEEKQQLVKGNSDKDNEIESLNKKTSLLEEEKQQLVKENSDKDNEIKSLNEETSLLIGSLDPQSNLLFQENEQLKAENQEGIKIFKSKAEEINLLKQQVASLKEENEQLEIINQDSSETIIEGLTTIDLLKQEQEELKQEQKEMEEILEINGRYEQVLKLKMTFPEYLNLVAKNRKQEEKICSLKANNEAINKEYRDFVEKIFPIGDDHDQVMQIIGDQGRAIAKMNKATYRLLNTLSAVEREQNEWEAKIRDFLDTFQLNSLNRMRFLFVTHLGYIHRQQIKDIICQEPFQSSLEEEEFEDFFSSFHLD
ncbi:MAG: hypothetical protein LBN01_01175 [Endomicrobium sp.]|jgi:chromosome segregation ATPase|nr:hypothetical protein [Endomicrobium sp.]